MTQRNGLAAVKPGAKSNIALKFNAEDIIPELRLSARYQAVLHAIREALYWSASTLTLHQLVTEVNGVMKGIAKGRGLRKSREFYDFGINRGTLIATVMLYAPDISWKKITPEDSLYDPKIRVQQWALTLDEDTFLKMENDNRKEVIKRRRKTAK